MATSLTCSLSAAIRASSGSLSSTKPDLNTRKPGSGSGSSTWWAPIFGCPPDPDYIDSVAPLEKKTRMLDPENDIMSTRSRHRPRFPLGCFTEDKARQLRKKTMESSSFHDMMYHSAIASRLASDTSTWHAQ